MKRTKFMKTNILFGILLLTLCLFTGSCRNDDKAVIEPAPEFELVTEISETEPLFIVPDQTFKLEYTAKNIKSIATNTLPEGWTAEVKESENSINIKATSEAASKATLIITATNASAQEVSKEITLQCLNFFDDTKGTFILNEGNMTTENGSLTYITADGYVFDDAYKTVNGTELGNVAQDMAFCDGKIYIITQNGDENAVGTKLENDGMLIVVNAKTLKKEMAFSRSDLSTLDWPTHIAALDAEHVYIRDNKGVYRLNTNTKELTFVSGTDNAPKSRFVTMNGKVYTYKAGTLNGIIEISPENDNATKINFPYRVEISINEVLGIQAAENGDIWVMSFGFEKSAMNKFNVESKKIIQRQINVKPSVGSSGVAFASYDNNIYYADGTTIYRLKFDEDESLNAASGLDAEETLTDLSAIDNNAGLLYNGLGVHPVTGNVYINTIKSFAQYTQNTIWSFDFNNSAENPAAKYENYTNFPAGFFFAPGK